PFGDAWRDATIRPSLVRKGATGFEGASSHVIALSHPAASCLPGRRRRSPCEGATGTPMGPALTVAQTSPVSGAASCAAGAARNNWRTRGRLPATPACTKDRFRPHWYTLFASPTPCTET